MPVNEAPGRAHLVLVPGFAGFDVLGQIEYYAGVTPLLQDWKRATGTHHAVLHYFDNLPTANVATRAKRLGEYLAKRIARGEFQPGDTLALVGHSTGGLDIRRMVLDLAERARSERDETIPVDGAAETASRVLPEEILGMQVRLVFLSVPQWGTNIADWVRAHPSARKRIVELFRSAVAAARLPKVDTVQSLVMGLASNVTHANVFQAVQDALAEMDEHAVPRDAIDRPSRIADAQDAESQVALWLRHIETDFGAIDDLASGVPPNRSSPAQFDPEWRMEEQATWDNTGSPRVRTPPWHRGRTSWVPSSPCRCSISAGHGRLLRRPVSGTRTSRFGFATEHAPEGRSLTPRGAFLGCCSSPVTANHGPSSPGTTTGS